MDAKELLSNRYATAFLHVFGNVLTIDDITKVTELKSFLDHHRFLLVMLKIPTLSFSEKREMLSKLFARHGLASAWLLLVDLLMKDRRIFLLLPVLGSIVRLFADYKNVMPCTIISSHTLNVRQQDAILRFVERKVGKKIIPHHAVDASLIAGISIKSEKFFWEHSVRRQLQRMREPLIQKGYYEY